MDKNFEKGDNVEVEFGGVWVPATVLHDQHTRIAVKLQTPVIYIEKTTTITAPLFFFGRKQSDEFVTKIYITEATVSILRVRYP